MGLGVSVLVCAIYVAKINWHKAADEAFVRVGNKNQIEGEVLLQKDWKSASENKEIENRESENNEEELTDLLGEKEKGDKSLDID